MMPIRKRFNTRQQIFESVESAMYEAISPQVLGISVVISAAKNVAISMFVDEVLPEEERCYLEVVLEEIMHSGPPWVASAQITVFDNATQPLMPIGTWMFIRKGVQADRRLATVQSVSSETMEQSLDTASVPSAQEDAQLAGNQERFCLLRQPAYQPLRRASRHRSCSPALRV